MKLFNCLNLISECLAQFALSDMTPTCMFVFLWFQFSPAGDCIIGQAWDLYIFVGTLWWTLDLQTWMPTWYNVITTRLRLSQLEIIPGHFVVFIREGCGKSKWKFKMAFAMRGGGSRGGLECHIPILKNDFCWKPFRIIPWLLKRVLHLVWALYYVYIVVEMTLNMAK